jgi:hypothetical protein
MMITAKTAKTITERLLKLASETAYSDGWEQNDGVWVKWEEIREDDKNKKIITTDMKTA